MMKWLFGMVLAWGVLLNSGCATTYQVPDYYETKTVPYTYQVGEVHSIDELRPSKQVKQTKGLPEGWVTHRAYKKQTLFE